jgi:hypothetical protein
MPNPPAVQDIHATSQFFYYGESCVLLCRTAMKILTFYSSATISTLNAEGRLRRSNRTRKYRLMNDLVPEPPWPS